MSSADSSEPQVIQVASRSSAAITVSVNPSQPASDSSPNPTISPRHVHDDSEILISSPVHSEAQPNTIINNSPPAETNEKSKSPELAVTLTAPLHLSAAENSSSEETTDDQVPPPMMSPRPLKLAATELVETAEELNPTTPMLKCSLCFKQTSKAQQCDNSKCIFTGKPVCAHCIIAIDQGKGKKGKQFCASCYAESAHKSQGCQCSVQ
jgi:hypothetical protein